MYDNITLEVFSIFNELPSGYSEVSVNNDLFPLIVGNDETVKLPIVWKGLNKAGKRTRKFIIQGTPIWVTYNGKGEKYANTLTMKTEDAKRLQKEIGEITDF